MPQLPFFQTLRPGPGALVVLGHVLLGFALMRHAGPPARGPEPAPAAYIELAFITAPRMAAPAAAIDPGPAAAPRSPRRRPAATAPVESTLVAVPVLAAEETHAAAAPDVAAPGRIDMESLRAAARHLDSERGPAALEPLRASDDSGLARAVRRAKVPDCQTKYAGGEKADILLLVPLAIDTITGKGCNW